MSQVILGDRQDNGKWGMDKLCRTGNGMERSQGNREANGEWRGQIERRNRMIGHRKIGREMGNGRVRSDR